jgi:hypothetical protein
MGSKATFFSLCDVAVRGLQKAAVSLKYLVLNVSGQGGETWGCVNNGGIIASDVNDEE